MLGGNFPFMKYTFNIFKSKFLIKFLRFGFRQYLFQTTQNQSTNGGETLVEILFRAYIPD